jgi:hypothetical protein
MFGEVRSTYLAHVYLTYQITVEFHVDNDILQKLAISTQTFSISTEIDNFQ